MTDLVKIPFTDYSNENSTFSIRASAPSDAEITALFDSIVAITLGNAQKSVLTTSTDKDAGTLGAPANGFAQREIKWLLKYTDAVTGDKYRAEIPCADLAFAVSGTDNLDLSGTEGAALKTAFEALAVSKDGNAVTLDEVQFVGRNT